MRQAEKTRFKKMELEEKRKKEIEKEEKIKEIFHQNNSALMHERKDKLFQKLSHTDEKIANIQRKQKESIDQKRNLSHIKSQELLQNIVKIKEAQDEKNHKLLEKMAKDNSRTQLMKQEQEAIIKIHQKLQQEMELKKKELLNSYNLRRELLKANTSY